jgi:hypothetical protein
MSARFGGSSIFFTFFYFYSLLLLSIFIDAATSLTYSLLAILSQAFAFSLF